MSEEKKVKQVRKAVKKEVVKPEVAEVEVKFECRNIHPLLKKFAYEQLPVNKQEKGKAFYDLAVEMNKSHEDSKFKNAGLRALLTARNEFIMAR